MHVGINAAVLNESNLCGTGWYLVHLLRALMQADPLSVFHLISNKTILHVQKTDNCRCHTIPGRGLSYWGISEAIKDLSCDVAFVPGEVVPLRRTAPIVITVHDLFPLLCSKQIRRTLSFRNKLHYFLASTIHFKRADLILAVSENTKKDIIELCGIPPQKIQVVPHGVDKGQFYPREKEKMAAALKKYSIERPYFINTSSVWWERKNLIRLIQAFALFTSADRDCQLVITGNRGSSYEEMKDLICRLSMEKKILLLEYIERADLPLLLSGAVGLVFPSLHEGFGLPLLEAMSCGCPVITSHSSAMLEVGGDAALFVNPLDVDSIEHAMREIYHDKMMRQQLCAKGIQRASVFSWERTAHLTYQAFHSVVT